MKATRTFSVALEGLAMNRLTLDGVALNRLALAIAIRIAIGMGASSVTSCAFQSPTPGAKTPDQTNVNVVASEFIYEKAPFPSCHASTIEEIPGGVIAAWFGGTAEKNPDVGIWVSRNTGQGWSTPVEVVNG